MLSLLLLRHAKTHYTQVFPDLTAEGLLATKELACSHIAKWMQRNGVSRKELRIFSSPAARAHGTAHVIKQELLYFAEIALEEDIRPMDLYDLDRCMRLIRELRGYINWESEPTFNDPELFEPRASVRKRSLGHLAKQLKQAKSGTIPRFGIGVSHYETLCHIAAELFGIMPTRETELRYLEPIELDFWEREDGTIQALGRFRDIFRKASFDPLRAEFRP